MVRKGGAWEELGRRKLIMLLRVDSQNKVAAQDEALRHKA